MEGGPGLLALERGAPAAGQRWRELLALERGASASGTQTRWQLYGDESFLEGGWREGCASWQPLYPPPSRRWGESQATNVPTKPPVAGDRGTTCPAVAWGGLTPQGTAFCPAWPGIAPDFSDPDGRGRAKEESRAAPGCVARCRPCRVEGENRVSKEIKNKGVEVHLNRG